VVGRPDTGRRVASVVVTAAMDGTVEPGFERVRDAFAVNLGEHGDVGAAFAAWHRGRPVVSLWGGVADDTSGRPWSEDTTVLVFSMTKALTATCVHHLAERGGLDLDVPITAWWPEFGGQGKEAVTLRMILGHRAGLPVVEGHFSMDEVLSWDPVVEALAGQTPLWEPDSAHGYHLRTYGWLVGEVFRRATGGRTVARYAEEEVVGPIGVDWTIGLHADRSGDVARLVPPPPDYLEMLASLGDLLLVRAAGTPSDLFRYDDMWNEPRLRAAELPSSTSFTNAAQAARFYAELVGMGDGPGILRPETLASAVELRSAGPDRVLLIETAFGSGYMLAATLPSAAGPRSFGHSGAGGSVGFVDPDAGLAIAYTTNTLRFEASLDARSESLVSALYDCLA